MSEPTIHLTTTTLPTGATGMTDTNNIRRPLPSEMPRIDYENLEPHPLAAKLPMIKDDKFEELKKDIERHGLEQKIILFSGNPDGSTGSVRVLDGRNRYKALKVLDRKASKSSRARMPRPTPRSSPSITTGANRPPRR
jgi:hypothetical protein